MNLFIFGYGDIGNRVARIAVEQQSTVQVFSRGKKFPFEDKLAKIEHKFCDLDDTDSLTGLNLSGSVVLYLAPPPGGGIVDSRVRNFLGSILPGAEPAKIVYLSTTSVYGECGDELITEDRPANPSNHTAARRRDAEESFLSWGAERSVPVVILRVSGIYGPGRIPMQRIIAREPLLADDAAGYTNRIHADDLATICLAAIEKGEGGEVFNVSDGELSKMTDYFNAITDLLCLERLPQVPLESARQVMSPLMFSYMSESRKISNRKMLEKLGIKLKYPTLMDGLKAALSEQLPQK